jgi:hypothetical protein
MPSFVRETLSLTSIAPDRIPADAPLEAWNNGQNVIYRNGESVRSRGDAPTLPGAKPPLTMVYVEPFDQGFWVYANAAGIWAHDGTDQFDITPASGWTGDVTNAVWTADVINGLAVINCSTRSPVYWLGEVTGACEPLPGWPSGGRCLSMRAHKNFLFAVGMLSEGAQRVRWSDAAEAGVIPQEWEPSASNLAGFVDLAPLSSPCVEGATLRDSFLVYKRKSIWTLDFVGGNTVFSARKLFAEIGCADTNALTAGPNDEHLFIGSDGDAHVTDGAQVVSILDGRAQRTFYGDFAAAQHLTFSAVTLQREKTGFLIYPGSGQLLGTLALVYDFASGDLGMREMPQVTCAADGQELRDVGDDNTWDGDDEAWNLDNSPWNAEISAQSVEDCLIGGAFGFRVLEQAEEGAATGISARLEKTGLSFGDAQRRKMIKAVWPKLEGTEGDVVTFRVGGQEKSGGPVTWAGPVDYAIGQESPVECFVQGRFMAIEVSSQGGDPWRLGTLDVEYRGVGGW